MLARLGMVDLRRAVDEEFRVAKASWIASEETWTAAKIEYLAAEREYEDICDAWSFDERNAEDALKEAFEDVENVWNVVEDAWFDAEQRFEEMEYSWEDAEREVVHLEEVTWKNAVVDLLDAEGVWQTAEDARRAAVDVRTAEEARIKAETAWEGLQNCRRVAEQKWRSGRDEVDVALFRADEVVWRGAVQHLRAALEDWQVVKAAWSAHLG